MGGGINSGTNTGNTGKSKGTGNFAENENFSQKIMLKAPAKSRV
jgi:hypothetical protein